MTTIESVPFVLSEREKEESYICYTTAVIDIAHSDWVHDERVIEHIARAFFNMQKPMVDNSDITPKAKFERDMWLASSFNYAHSCFGLHGGVAKIIEEEGLLELVDTAEKRELLEGRVNKAIHSFSLSPTFAPPIPIVNL